MARTKDTAKSKPKSEKKSKHAKKAVKDVKKVRKSTLAGAGGIKKPHRWHPGVATGREIKRLQTGRDKDKKLITRVAIDRIARELASRHTREDMRFEGKAINELREVTEFMTVKLFQETMRLNALREGRVGINVLALKLAAERVFEGFLDSPSAGSYSSGSGSSGAKKKASKKLKVSKKAIVDEPAVAEEEESDSTVDTRTDAVSENAVDDSAMDQDTAATTVDAV